MVVAPTSAAFQRDVLIGRGPGIAAHQPYGRFADPWPDAAQRRYLPERRRDDLFLHKLLNLEQQRLTFCVIQVARLLLEQRVDIGVVAVGVGAALDGEGLEPGCGVAESGTAAHDQTLVVFLLGEALEERCALDWPQIGPDADLAQAVPH